MADDSDPWANTKRLLGDDIFDLVEPTEAEVKTAFEEELTASHEQDRPFSVLAFLAGVRGSGLTQVGPGTYAALRPRGSDSSQRLGLRLLLNVPPRDTRGPAPGDRAGVSSLAQTVLPPVTLKACKTFSSVP